MNRVQKVNKLTLALVKMEEARKLIEEVQRDSSDNFYLSADAEYYARKVQELMGNDEEQGGLRSLIEEVKAKPPKMYIEKYTTKGCKCKGDYSDRWTFCSDHSGCECGITKHHYHCPDCKGLTQVG